MQLFFRSPLRGYDGLDKYNTWHLTAIHTHEIARRCLYEIADLYFPTDLHRPIFYSSLAVEMSCKYKILKAFFGSCFLISQYASEFYFNYLISGFIHSVQIISQSFNSSQRKRKKSYKIFLIIHFDILLC